MKIILLPYKHVSNYPISTCFRHLYAHHQEKRPRVTAYGVYLLVVLDVAVCGTVVLR